MRVRRTTQWCAVLLLGLGCGADPPAVVRSVPVHSRAMWVLEPPTLAIGEVATLEVAVVTAPNQRVRPLSTPDSVDGLWILETETLPIVREPNRWIHRTRVRVRPREVGHFTWPATPIEIESDGEVETLTADGIELEVLSVIPQYVGKLTPFGLEPLVAESRGTRPWAWAAGGAGLTLACLGLVWLARRESQRPGPTQPGGEPRARVWETALGALERALEQADADPTGASRNASRVLRNYMDQRFGASPMGRAPASTSAELERMKPPFAATSRWPAFVALVRRLDESQFSRPAQPTSARTTAAERTIRDAAAFVRETIPQGPTR